MDGHPKWTRDTTWRQGHVLDAETATAAGLNVGDATCVVVISHDCDLANDNLEIEPNVEVIVGRLVAGANGNFCWGKAPRTLHLMMTREGAEVIVELVTTEKRHVAKQVLTGSSKPNVAYALDGKGLAVLRSWLAARYNRAAFPDSFVRRMAETKLNERLAKIIEPRGKLISFVYFDIDKGQLLEREDGDPYELSIVLVYPPGNDPEAAAEDVDAVANSVRDAFERKLTLGRIISFQNCLAISEDDISVAQAKTLLQWRLEHMTLKADEEQPGPSPV
jgi:hypothetical protein